MVDVPLPLVLIGNGGCGGCANVDGLAGFLPFLLPDLYTAGSSSSL